VTALGFQHDDGGRADAGWRGGAGDCTTRAVAIALELAYQEAYDARNLAALTERPRKGRKRSSARNGVHVRTLRRWLDAMGWVWTPTMSIGSGCRVHLRRDELPDTGPVICNVSRHIVTVIDGVIHDTVPGVDRDGTRCVYGYWTPPPESGSLRRPLSRSATDPGTIDPTESEH